MAKQNLAFLLGVVAREVKVVKDADGNNLYAMAYLVVARADRDVGDHSKYMHLDDPIIMSKDENIVRVMETWKVNDVVYIKGVVSSKHIKKTSFCEYCGAKNSFPGALVYVNPIYVRKEAHFDTQEECTKFLAENREISNQALIMGTLCRDPSRYTTKKGHHVTQYQIAINRKYHIKEDPPEIKSDYPWVKSYGENARKDAYYLRIGSTVYIDGCLQARSVNRHAWCGQAYDLKSNPMYYKGGEPVMVLGNVKDAVARKDNPGEIMLPEEYVQLVQAKDEYGDLMYHEEGKPVLIQKRVEAVIGGEKVSCLVFDKQGFPVYTGCGEMYDWKDRVMELVPYATEYLYNFLDDEEAEAREQARSEQQKNDLAANEAAKEKDAFEEAENNEE